MKPPTEKLLMVWGKEKSGKGWLYSVDGLTLLSIHSAQTGLVLKKSQEFGVDLGEVGGLLWSKYTGRMYKILKK